MQIGYLLGRFVHGKRKEVGSTATAERPRTRRGIWYQISYGFCVFPWPRVATVLTPLPVSLFFPPFPSLTLVEHVYIFLFIHVRTCVYILIAYGNPTKYHVHQTDRLKNYLYIALSSYIIGIFYLLIYMILYG